MGNMPRPLPSLAWQVAHFFRYTASPLSSLPGARGMIMTRSVNVSLVRASSVSLNTGQVVGNSIEAR